MKLHAHWNLLSWIFFTFLLLIHTVSVQSVRVEGFIGESVTLPCSFGQKPQTVFWRNDDSRVVCDIIRGEADFNEQDPVYKDRVEISQSEIDKGNFSIMLSNMKESDSGQYTCIIPNSKTLTLELTVKEKPTTTERKNPTPLTDESPRRADCPLTFLLGCALLFNLTF